MIQTTPIIRTGQQPITIDSCERSGFRVNTIDLQAISLSSLVDHNQVAGKAVQFSTRFGERRYCQVWRLTNALQDLAPQIIDDQQSASDLSEAITRCFESGISGMNPDAGIVLVFRPLSSQLH